MRIRHLIFVSALALLLVAFVYRRTPIQFLRAESGWYLSMSHSSDAVQNRFRRDFFTHSYGGHYTPLAFLAEFEMAKLGGTSRTFWKWRQLTVLAGVGAALFAMTASIGSVFSLRLHERMLLAAALAATAIFQPQMTDLVAWPFMAIQLIWIVLSALAMCATIRAVTSAATVRWAWFAATAAYASMHVSGLGVVTVAGTAAALFVIIRQRKLEHDGGQWREVAGALVTMLVCSAAHACVMAWPIANVVSSGGSEPRSGLMMIKLVLGFVARFAAAGVRAFSGITSAEAHPFAIAYLWPYGALLVLALIVIFATHLRRISKTIESTVTSAIVVSSIASFFTLIALIVARQLSEKTLHSTATTLGYFTSEPRYVVPLNSLFIAPAALGFALLFRCGPRVMSFICVTIFAAVVITQMEFQATARPYLDPPSRVSHYSVWRLIVTTARECRTAGLPLPNLPLGEVTREFYDVDARMFEPLLRRELHLDSDQRIELLPWENYLAGDKTMYGAVPSLRPLEQKLKVKED